MGADLVEDEELRGVPDCFCYCETDLRVRLDYVIFGLGWMG